MQHGLTVVVLIPEVVAWANVVRVVVGGDVGAEEREVVAGSVVVG